MLFNITFDGEQYWVEAGSFQEAIDAWKERVKQEWGPDFDGTELPDSVVRLSEDPVIRPVQPKNVQGGYSSQEFNELQQHSDQLTITRCHQLLDAAKVKGGTLDERIHEIVAALSA